MNCQQFDAEIDELVDQRLPADSDASLRNHAERCPRCARLMADYASMLDAIDLAPSPDSNELGARILAELTRPAASPAQPVELPNKNSQRVTVRRVAWGVAASAAVLLITVVSLHRSRPANRPAPIPDIAKSTGARSRTPNDRLVAISMEEIHTVADMIDAQHRNFEQVSDRLRPMTRSMSAAFRALQHSQPRSDLPARSS